MEPTRTGGLPVADVPDLTGGRRRGLLVGMLGVRMQLAALVLLIVGVSLEQPAFVVAGLTVKPEHIALLAVWALVGWRLFLTGKFAKARLLFWTIALLAVLLVASVLNAPERTESVRHTVMVALVTSAAWLTFGLINTRKALFQAVNLLIALACAEAILTFLVLAFAWSWIPPGAQIGAGGVAVPTGTLWEPNFLGSFLAAGAILALATLIAEVSPRRAMVRACCLSLILAGLGLSLARGAWLGLGLGLVVLLAGYALWRVRAVAFRIDSRPAQTRSNNLVLALAASVLAALFLVALAPVVFPGTGSILINRVNVASYDPQADPSLRARVDSLQDAMPGIKVHPFIGNGAGSFAVGHLDVKGNPGWISNLEFHVLYDSGLVGLACWIAGIAGLIWASGRVLTREMESQEFQWTTLGLLAALAALLMAFQVTEGSWLAFPWVYVGLLASAGSMRARSAGAPAEQKAA